ncbi:S-methyl-5-thioribose-1-phosphate isomerase [Lachnoclostridium sp.]|uniref:S-methyl-5-thioribose-1-phosphate isomerase n=1 Tax=Lachnoclostridium sp. TaxID=2028282 RepID=UPI0028A03A03|nr:S-methyl-5-thioribose-1-phosphate isomerase [Lachnoclostridium sp.]
MENVTLSPDGKTVVIIDQTKLPNAIEYLTLSTPRQMYDSIFALKLRGALCIGICAGFSIYCLAQTIEETEYDAFLLKFREYKDYLDSSRPTAVNLSWALKRMEKVVLDAKDKSIVEIISLLKAECIAIKEEDIKICKAISEYGLEFLKDGDGILTHCNAGPLATSQYGTALGPLILGKERGMSFKVFADETRPLLQGARLTAFELHEAGIDVTLICDNMASIVMKNGFINACFVGCDRVAENGDTANKIGTSGVAILAKHYGIPFYVMCPTSTIDLNCKTGDDIEIELRSEDEIKSKWYEKPMAPSDVKCYNPAFDVTDHNLITAIITEHGVCKAPFEVSLKEAVQKAQDKIKK